MWVKLSGFTGAEASESAPSLVSHGCSQWQQPRWPDKDSQRSEGFFSRSQGTSSSLHAQWCISYYISHFYLKDPHNVLSRTNAVTRVKELLQTRGQHWVQLEEAAVFMLSDLGEWKHLGESVGIMNVKGVTSSNPNLWGTSLARTGSKMDLATWTKDRTDAKKAVSLSLETGKFNYFSYFVKVFHLGHFIVFYKWTTGEVTSAIVLGGFMTFGWQVLVQVVTFVLD